LRFDPASTEGGARFNPLEEIRLGTLHEVGDVQNLVTIPVDPERQGTCRPLGQDRACLSDGRPVAYALREESRRRDRGVKGMVWVISSYNAPSFDTVSG
jgi:hypothetical protein